MFWQPVTKYCDTKVLTCIVPQTHLYNYVHNLTRQQDARSPLVSMGTNDACLCCHPLSSCRLTRVPAVTSHEPETPGDDGKEHSRGQPTNQPMRTVFHQKHPLINSQAKQNHNTGGEPRTLDVLFVYGAIIGLEEWLSTSAGGCVCGLKAGLRSATTRQETNSRSWD